MKRKIKYAILMVSVFGIVFFSCKKEQQLPSTFWGYDYFPNKVGHYVIYQCDSIIVNPYSTKFPPFDTFTYQIKEVIDSIYPNNSGQLTQRIVRYKRTNDSIPWTNISTSEKVWTGNLLSNMAKRQEDNYVYVKLVFPMSLNEVWNGNVFNTIGQWNYQYTTLNTPATINGTTFDSTLIVLQQKDSSLLNYQYYLEQYAAGVGLVYKKIIDYNTSKLSFSSPPSADSATSGTILYLETYLSSGNQ